MEEVAGKVGKLEEKLAVTALGQTGGGDIKRIREEMEEVELYEQKYIPDV